MEDVFVVGMARTPFGSFQGSLSSLAAPRLGAIAIEAALKRSGIKRQEVSEVIMGNVLGAGVGQAPARQAMIYAGLPESTPALTINKVCGSGMKALMLAAQSIQLGDSDVVVAGGMENMSQAPFLVNGARSGFRMGNQTMIDGMIHDGLWDPYNQQHMGNCAELCAREEKFSRKEQDDFAIESFKRAQKAWTDGKFNSEVVAVPIEWKGKTTLVEADEGPSKVQFDKIPNLKPAFAKPGDAAASVTAANSSTINDGAAALVLASGKKVRELGLTPLAKIVSTGTHAQKPEWFTTAPAGAMNAALQKAMWKIDQVDLFEVNEAFAVVALAAARELKIPHSKLNIWGGAIALGHPIGASGARIVMTLISALKDAKKKRGIAGICIGGGEATSICLELT
jgi:acetyl-CoA C-acetyltransferase